MSEVQLVFLTESLARPIHVSCMTYCSRCCITNGLVMQINDESGAESGRITVTRRNADAIGDQGMILATAVIVL